MAHRPRRFDSQTSSKVSFWGASSQKRLTIVKLLRMRMRTSKRLCLREPLQVRKEAALARRLVSMHASPLHVHVVPAAPSRLQHVPTCSSFHVAATVRGARMLKDLVDKRWTTRTRRSRAAHRRRQWQNSFLNAGEQRGGGKGAEKLSFEAQCARPCLH
eukprot:CAMPEP_0196659858 /NCGR_PEP_ID=MMETSP1086-20130531/36860_1 /TAXON_ID=77921 /ORGANISM="Cyanoptyche  gloeocystis , Strain SAG4.97" /LENGTH=158 /DNA_ID=CAMNT_0041993995 /DNA_START=464 /DNA_END=940 /DNA_ORIENTATION=+